MSFNLYLHTHPEHTHAHSELLPPAFLLHTGGQCFSVFLLSYMTARQTCLAQDGFLRS